MKANRVARIKAEQRRILREEGESINRLLRKVLPKLNLVLTEAGLIRIRRRKNNDKGNNNMAH